MIIDNYNYTLSTIANYNDYGFNNSF